MNQATVNQEYQTLQHEYSDFLQSVTIKDSDNGNSDDGSGSQVAWIRTLENVGLCVRVSSLGWEVSS